MTGDRLTHIRQKLEYAKKSVAPAVCSIEDAGYLLDLLTQAPECEKCDSRHADWLETPYPHSILNPPPACREAGFKHRPEHPDAETLRKEFEGKRWVVGYMAIEEDPWGVHGPMDDGRDHVYPIAWLSTKRQAESVAYALNAFAPGGVGVGDG